ncbi:MAG: hypothetical protein KDC85_20190 [Saprospiraceae bacterium]|nr:hypothetical protein [Saprospiraceae bacterium]MCB9322698.1 hypothetical protein [Lewinellaceae bacterium]
MSIKKIKSFYKSITTNYLLKRFFAASGKEIGNGKKILIYAGIGHMYISYFEILMYHLLKREGYEVDYLIYDEHIRSNEVITKEVIQKSGKIKFWNRSVKNAVSLLKRAKVDFEFIDAKDKDIAAEIETLGGNLDNIFAFEKDGIRIGEMVKGTMYRYYKSLTFDDDALQVGKDFLHTALVNYYEIAKRTGAKKYDYVLFSHGIYVTWEPVMEYCKKENIDFISYDRAKTKNTVNINFNQVAPDWSFDQAWERFSDRRLTSEEERLVEKYLKDRELQSNDVYSYNFSERENDIRELKTMLKIPLDTRVITVFTNLIWDAANVARDLAFESAFECLTHTIEHYKNREDVHVVLRAHPAEKVLGTKERYGDLLRQYYGNDFPQNVTIIDPEMAINSFSVIDISDIGVVNTSTIGLEFALSGKPVLLISETHYRNKGFTFDVNSRKEYFSVMEDLLMNPKLKDSQIDLARKYFFIMMFKYQHKTPLLYENGVFRRYSYGTLNKAAEDPVLKNMLARIREGKNIDFVNWE